MPRKPTPQLLAWSYSRWKTYTQCPLKVKFQAIDKIKEEKGPVLIRGQEIHDLADKFVKGILKKMPKEIELFDEEFLELRDAFTEGDVDAEQMLCFDKNWGLIADKWSKNIWCRIKTDSTVLMDGAVCKIIDYKTGQVRDKSDIEQLELYALSAFLVYEGVKEVHVELWYLDHGVIMPDPIKVFKISQLNSLKTKWEKRVKKMLTDTRFDPTPNEFCKWCFYRKEKNGNCKY